MTWNYWPNTFCATSVPERDVNRLALQQMQFGECVEDCHKYDWIIFTSPNGVEAFFEMFHKIYHDARAVEVISHCRRKTSYKVRPWSRGQRPELDRKWELNRFLQKWLGFCVKQGHLFLRATTLSLDGPQMFTSLDSDDNASRTWRWDKDSPL